MEKKIIDDFLGVKINSINDFSQEETKLICDKFYAQNKSVITSVLSYTERNFTLKGKRLCPCFKTDLIEMDDDILVPTRFKYSTKEQMIPKEFVVLMESIIQKENYEQGIFRKPPNITQRKECEKIFFDSLEHGKSIDDLMKELSKYDAIVLSSIFKQLFSRSYISIFPASFFQIIKRIMILEDEREKFILSKYLVFSMPMANRKLFESILNFLILMHEIATDRGVDYEGHLDIKGYGTIIMPNLFLGNEKNVTFRDLSDLADYAGYLMLNIKNILEVTED